jgi:outer membrane protein assembly factor BamB
MNMKINKPRIIAVLFVLMLSITATVVTLPTAIAHDPPWTIPTWTYLEAYPDPIGVGQSIFLVFWRDYLPRTAEGMYGDRWDFTIEVTKPDNSKETLGPYTCDPVGGGFAFYTPDQVGTYSFICYFPGHVYGTSGLRNPQTTYQQGEIYYDDVLLPSESLPATVVVQQDALEPWPDAQLPTDYWTRPVDASLREWNTVSGNWLNDGRRNLDTTAPKTAHIVWTKPETFGGLTGGRDYGTIGYYEGSSYERKWAPVAIMQGRLYYRVERSSQPQTRGTMCVDLRTGEELLFMNRTMITNGVIYMYQSPNQHGTIPYLLKSGTSSNIFDPTASTPSYEFYDPFTGEWLWTITDRPSGISAVGKNGEPLIYVINTRNHWMALWNATAPDGLFGGTSGTGQWQWRPVGKTINGTAGAYEFNDAYIWNVSIPANLPDTSTSFMQVCSDRIIMGSTSAYGTDPVGFQMFGGRAYSGTADVWALSLEPGHEGELIFKTTITSPEANQTLQFEGDKVDEEAGLFFVRAKETMQWMAFDLDTGALVWGPTERQEDFMMYDRASTIYNGMLLADGYSGVYAYDDTDGSFKWLFRTDKCELEGPYEYWPVSTIVPADGKIYVTTGEHSHTQPLFRGWSMYCVDANTGEGIWNITGVWGTPVIADGYLVSMNGMDNQIYCFGKGPTQTTVEAPLTAIPKGSGVIIQGTVLDKSSGATTSDMMARYPNGLPAIADVDMTEWMEHVYKQHELPMNAQGVPVTIDAIDPNGNFVHIATVTSDMSGLYSYQWMPENEGKYTVIATFEGSDAYFASYAETAIGVGPAVAPSGPIEPEPTEPTEAPLITTELAIILAVIVVAVIGIAAYWVLRKRK